ncbi:DUF63 family protein [Halomarina halobia]|uniref:DUF63 family protein n=1 Tax=Halomarina halobia TaxID=3033386 RepID=A0ABD6A857_9EURY|nr:DUF63 family protein [Halomarina sp. PSR21]
MSPAAPNLAWTAFGVLGTLVVTAASWELLRQIAPTVADRAGYVGLFAVFGQVLDGVSTLIGVDALSLAERVPLSRAILGVAAELPTAPLFGTGWLFVLVKLGLALAVVVAVADLRGADDDYRRGVLLAAGLVGLIPGLSNLWLYATV